MKAFVLFEYSAKLRLSRVCSVCAYTHEVMGVSCAVVPQGHVDSTHTDSARGKHKPC